MFRYIGTQPLTYVSTFFDGLLSRDFGMAVQCIQLENRKQSQQPVSTSLQGEQLVDQSTKNDCISSLRLAAIFLDLLMKICIIHTHCSQNEYNTIGNYNRYLFIYILFQELCIMTTYRGSKRKAREKTQNESQQIKKKCI